MIDNTWVPDVDHTQQPHYQHVVDCTYFSVLGSFDYWNIIRLINKTTLSEDFYEVHKFALDGISANMESLL